MKFKILILSYWLNRQNRNLKFKSSSLASRDALSNTVNQYPYYFLFSQFFFSDSNLRSLFYLLKLIILAHPLVVYSMVALV